MAHVNAPAPSANLTVPAGEWFGHPKGLRTLFFTEAWERFSFYGMRALLTLYMVNELKYHEADRAQPIYGAYGALVYAFPVVGGWIANKFIGYRRSINLGAVLMALGHFAMAIESTPAFFLALGLLCVGNGFFKPNISSTVGRLYKPNDTRRDRGFTIFYMGINLGAFVSPIVCGMLKQYLNVHWGFAAAGFGMLAGLIWFNVGKYWLGNLAEAAVEPSKATVNLITVGAFLAAPASAYALYYPAVGKGIIQGVSILVLVILLFFTMQQKGAARLKMFALISLMFFHMLFWAGFEQAGSSFNVMTDKYVDRHIFGFEFDASVFQSVNAVFIILLAPIFTMIWRSLSSANKEPSIPLKFALGLGQMGLGFWVLKYGIGFANEQAVVPLIWMALCYFFHTTGELCLSPVGLSAVTKLAPDKWVGFCMGAWFLTISNAHILASNIAKLTASDSGDKKLEGKAALANYASVFGDVFMIAMGAAVLLFILTPFIKKLMPDVK